eukprot:scaffold45788_cov54-Phaeocystis_antarctica.AAC.1
MGALPVRRSVVGRYSNCSQWHGGASCERISEWLLTSPNPPDDVQFSGRRAVQRGALAGCLQGLLQRCAFVTVFIEGSTDLPERTQSSPKAWKPCTSAARSRRAAAPHSAAPHAPSRSALHPVSCWHRLAPLASRLPRHDSYRRRCVRVLSPEPTSLLSAES